MKTNKLFLLLTLTFAVLVSSCSKDDEPDVRDFETIGFEKEAVLNKLPEGLKNSSDQYAQMAVSYVESALNWSGFADQLTPPEDAVKAGKKSNETYSWTWNYGGAYVMTMWWTYHDDNDKNYWDIDIQYGEGDRYNFLRAWESKDNSSGQILYNYQWMCAMEEPSEECADLFWTYNWSVDNEENYLFSYTIDADDESTGNSMDYQTSVNNDGSGSVKYFMGGILLYDLNWDADGNGSWVLYSGDSQMSGSWTAG